MSINTATIISLLEETKKIIEDGNKDISRGEEFEDYVFETIHGVGNSIGITNISQTGKQSFPDIIIGEYGIEVKFSNSQKWDSMGNSIFEGTYRHEVSKDIFVFFGKKNANGIEVKFDLYENCLSDIKVTHSPRFYINMEQDKDESILNQMGISYKEYRALSNSEKSKLIKKQLKNKLASGEEVWWMDEEVPPVIREYRNQSTEKKNKITAELFAYFPELLSNSSSKYMGPSVYLLSNYQLINSSLRDSFTAGGTVDFCVQGQIVNKVPKIYKKIYKLAPEIYKVIEETDLKILSEHWLDHDNVTMERIITDRHAVWKMLLNCYGRHSIPQGIRPSTIFEGGLGLTNVTLK